MANHILITGGTGTIGSHLIQRLKNSNASFTAMVRSEQKATDLEHLGVNTILGDFEDEDSIKNALKGVNKLFLLTPPTLNQDKYKQVAIQAAVANGIHQIVSVSAVGASEDATLHLGKMHGIGDKIVQDSGIPYAILRPHSFMQNFLGSIETIKSGQLYGSTGEAKIPYIDARDIADIAFHILMNKGYNNKVYTLTGPEAVSGLEVANSIGTEISKEVKYINIPFEVQRQALYDAGIPKWLVDDLVELNKIWSQGYGVEISSTTQDILGHKGRDIQSFARDYKAYFN